MENERTSMGIKVGGTRAVMKRRRRRRMTMTMTIMEILTTVVRLLPSLLPRFSHCIPVDGIFHPQVLIVLRLTRMLALNNDSLALYLPSL